MPNFQLSPRFPTELRAFLLRFMLLLIATLALWLGLVHQGLSSGFSHVVSLFIEAQFSRIHAQLEPNPEIKHFLDHNLWVVETYLLLPEAEQNRAKLLSWTLHITPILPYTLGLPLLWALLLASSYQRMRNLVLGSALIGLVVVCALWLKSWLAIANVMLEHPEARIFVGEGISVQNIPPPEWLVSTLRLVWASFFVYFAALLAPIGIFLWLNRLWWQSFLVLTTEKERERSS